MNVVLKLDTKLPNNEYDNDDKVMMHRLLLK
jgi:hypothetical protein